jgi:hypothetical protein
MQETTFPPLHFIPSHRVAAGRRAYSKYFQRHPEFSSSVLCDATNEWVLRKYDKSKPDECRALQSICKR